MELVCRRWRDTSRGSPQLWASVGWRGVVDPAAQARSLASFLAWLTSRAYPPTELHLHLLGDAGNQDAECAAQAADLVADIAAQAAPRLERLTLELVSG